MSKGETKAKKVTDDLGYLQMPDDPMQLDGWMRREGFKEKFIRKTKENPFVPIGLGAKKAALGYGLWQMKTGDRVMSQKMMRVRVAAQSFTVVALLAGVMYHNYQSSKS